MLKKEYENLDECTINQLKEIIKELSEENQTKDKIIQELEYRLKKLGIRIETEIEEHCFDNPELKPVMLKTKHIPAFEYIEKVELKGE